MNPFVWNHFSNFFENWEKYDIKKCIFRSVGVKKWKKCRLRTHLKIWFYIEIQLKWKWSTIFFKFMPTMTYPSGHVVKGRAEGSVNPCDLCERIVISLTTRLRKLLRAVEEGTAALYRKNQRDPPSCRLHCVLLGPICPPLYKRLKNATPGSHLY